MAGLDRTGVSADPARSVDPYLDGARTLAGLDRTGVSADPARSIDPYLDGANA
ncbi:hydroxyquinol 1,2-dioxygenase, partial [Cupriavidus metallidurans]